jgi:hypothetical protein
MKGAIYVVCDISGLRVYELSFLCGFIFSFWFRGGIFLSGFLAFFRLAVTGAAPKVYPWEVDGVVLITLGVTSLTTVHALDYWCDGDSDVVPFVTDCTFFAHGVIQDFHDLSAEKLGGCFCGDICVCYLEVDGGLTNCFCISYDHFLDYLSK